MFRRAFWFTTGAAAGVWATTRVQRKLRSLAPDSLAGRAVGRAADTGHRLRHFALDVRDGMAVREAELHDALGLTEGEADPDRLARTLPARPAHSPLPAAPAPELPRPARRAPRRQARANAGSPDVGGAHGTDRRAETNNPNNPNKPGKPGEPRESGESRELGKEDD